MTEQWQELKETIKELRYSNGDLTQQEVCSFLGVYMETLEKQMQESTYAKGTIIKSALKYLVKMQIEQGSVGFAVDNDHDHDCCWDDVLAWIEAQPCENCISRAEAIEKAIDAVDEWDGGCNKRRAEMIEKALKNLPPVIPQRKMGRWIDFNWNDGDICRWGIKCSECHTEYKHGGEMWHNPKFCPNCGSYNGGGEDETSD